MHDTRKHPADQISFAPRLIRLVGCFASKPALRIEAAYDLAIAKLVEGLRV